MCQMKTRFTLCRKLAPPEGGHYQELAGTLVQLARQCRFVCARRELYKLKESFERRAGRLDRRFW